jgi:hypothetical protein
MFCHQWLWRDIEWPYRVAVSPPFPAMSLGGAFRNAA